MNLEAKKKEIADRMTESRHIPSPREQQIQERNSPYNKNSNRAKIWKERHDRKHGKISNTASKESRNKFIDSMHQSHGRGYGD